MPKFRLKDIQELEKYTRISLINKVSGLKSANLIGTKSQKGLTNLAIFNSVIHIGTNPPLLGFLMRPLIVERHTYQNIKSTGFFTINQVSKEIHERAHLTSAKFTEEASEFKNCDLVEEYTDGFFAPFVKESKIKIGLSFQEEQLIKINNTILVVGKIEYLELPDENLAKDGDVDLEALGSIGVGGLDTYYECKRIARYKYARVGEELKEIK